MTDKHIIDNDIKEDICSWDVSLLLKQNGFNVFCNGTYTKYLVNTQYNKKGISYENGGILKGRNTDHRHLSNKYYELISAPTHDVALEWLRKNFNWHVELIWDTEKGAIVWFCSVSKIGDVQNKCIDLAYHVEPFDAVEEALKHMLNDNMRKVKSYSVRSGKIILDGQPNKK